MHEFFAMCCALALASATHFSASDVVFDQSVSDNSIDDISSSSSEVGSFGTDDTSALDNLLNLIDSLKNSGLDLTGDSVSGNDIFEDSSSDPSFDTVNLYSDNVSLYSSYDTYYGAISDTYLSYFRGFLPKLGFKEHYVVARISQYDYLFAYGEELVFNGTNIFSGDVTVIRINTDRYTTYQVYRDSSFSLNANSYLVYSDLGTIYPSLADVSAISLRQILILFIILCLCLTLEHMYNVRHYRRVRRNIDN